MKKSRFTEAQIMAVLRQAEGGVPVPELCREHGIKIWGYGCLYDEPDEGS